MPNIGTSPSPAKTVLLILELDPDARSRHEAVLDAAGYAVVALSGLPDATTIHGCGLVISDIPSFLWLQAQRFDRRLPPVVVVAADAREGVTACLAGAADWVPAAGTADYFLDTVADALPRQ
jgi:hypothetical protein